MADLLLIYRIRQRRRISEIRTSWYLKDLQNPFELPEWKFQKRFRLSRDAVKVLIEDLRPHLQIGANGYAIEIQVLTFLGILGTGSFQYVVGDGTLLQISQASASRFVRKVSDALQAIAKKFIAFPTTARDVLDVCRSFHENLGFPNVIGCIDGTRILIERPRCPDWFSFVDRKSDFSINVQMVCDSNLKILDVVARWPGSTHDSHVWNFSGLRELLSSGAIPQRIFLLGDSGYPLEPWLLVPYHDRDRPFSPAQITFNNKHRHTRNVIERCIGVLKSRFRLLHKSGGVIMYDPTTVCRLVIAAAVLHNICIVRNLPEPDPVLDDSSSDDEDDDDDDDTDDSNNRRAVNPVAQRIRDEIAARFQAAR